MRIVLFLGLLWMGSAVLPPETRAMGSDLYSLEVSVDSDYKTTGQSIPTVSDEAAPIVLEPLQDTTPGGPSTRYSLDLNSSEEETGASTPLFDDAAMANIDFNVPMVRTAKVDRHLQFFSYHIRDRFEQWLSRLERYRPTVQNIFSEFKLPLDLVFLSLVESGFNTHAVSRAKAVGPWQFMAPTAKIYGLRVDRWVDERRDPVKSTIAAAQYLRDLYHLFGSWPLAMAAYNAGEGKVGRSLARVDDGDFWSLLDTKLLRSETKEYVPRFVAARQIGKDPTRFGFNIQPQPPMEYDEVLITRPVHLKAAAKAAGVSFDDMKALNPELRRDMTPPDPVYILKVPTGKKAIMVANLPTFQGLYPAVYHEPKRALVQARGKAKAGLSRLTPSHRRAKSADWLKGKPGRGKGHVLAKASR
jgi:membrane-bound lytic murein transglycosylase D